MGEDRWEGSPQELLRTGAQLPAALAGFQCGASRRRQTMGARPRGGGAPIGCAALRHALRPRARRRAVGNVSALRTAEPGYGCAVALFSWRHGRAGTRPQSHSREGGRGEGDGGSNPKETALGGRGALRAAAAETEVGGELQRGSLRRDLVLFRGRAAQGAALLLRLPHLLQRPLGGPQPPARLQHRVPCSAPRVLSRCRPRGPPSPQRGARAGPGRRAEGGRLGSGLGTAGGGISRVASVVWAHR